MQCRDERWSPLAWLNSWGVPGDCQDFLLRQLMPQPQRMTAMEALNHPFLRRMAQCRARADPAAGRRLRFKCAACTPPNRLQNAF